MSVQVVEGGLVRQGGDGEVGEGPDHLDLGGGVVVAHHMGPRVGIGFGRQGTQDPRHLADEGCHGSTTAVGRTAADVLGTERIHLVGPDLVGTAEEGEQAPRVLRGRRWRRLAGRVAAGQDGRCGVMGVVDDRRRVAEPRRTRRQAVEVGEQRRVNPPLAVEERAEGQLVEHDHHDGGVAARVGDGAAVVREEHHRHGSQEKEPDGHHHRRRPEEADPGCRRQRTGTPPQDDTAEHRRAERERDAAETGDRGQDLRGEHGDEPGERGDVDDRGGPVGVATERTTDQTGELLDAPQDERGNEQHEEGERHQLDRAGAGGHERLGAIREHREHRLGHEGPRPASSASRAGSPRAGDGDLFPST
ncbi:MAG: hypothetical protein U5R31_08365 [Acidimicrobiia bacterium]|nr:hypothetical protein [Acidimicrobiia bacterium]